ncbi:MAG: hypothetical protein AAGA08_15750 [Pseudomonadota bacterium]
MIVSMRALTVASTLLALAACGDASEEQLASRADTIENAQALFSNICVANLPNLSGAKKSTLGLGFKVFRLAGPIKAYRITNKSTATAVALASNDRFRSCAVGFTGRHDAKDVVKALLAAVKQKPGGSPKERFESSEFVYAAQMRNDSALVYKSTQQRGELRHTVLFTSPLERSDLGALGLQ